MANLKRFLSLAVALCLVIGMCACGEETPAGTTAPQQSAPSTTPTEGITEIVDYAAAVELNPTAGTAQEEVTVKMYIDGDTTHFYVPSSVSSTGVLKARYLAVNTPESTGKIEEYGKKASAFTKEKLMNAESIIVESETAYWEADSTGDRYLSWVWYKPQGSDTYRNLNIELLQNGLAIASNSANNRYGEVCMKAINQAKAQKLNVHSGEKDPDFYYGAAMELTIKELRTNLEAYTGMTVAFNGVVTVNNNNSVYVEAYDAETDMYYGMAVYYGYNLNGPGMEILTVGNEVRIVGSVQYYEAGGTYQVSDLDYRLMKPDDPDNIQKISEGHTPAFVEITPEQFANGSVQILSEEGETREEPFAAMAMNTSVSMKNLQVIDTWTTTNAESSSKGAMTLTCQADGKTISVRTVVLYDADGKLVTADRYMGKTIDVQGIVDYYDGTYQIKVFSANDITVH